MGLDADAQLWALLIKGERSPRKKCLLAFNLLNTTVFPYAVLNICKISFIATETPAILYNKLLLFSPNIDLPPKCATSLVAPTDIML
jgi:hypothetical protein